MKCSAIILVCALMLSAAWPRDPSLVQLQRAISQRGARKVASELNQQDDPDPWESIESHVATGDPAWLDVARQLKPYTDGGISTGLENAVALALPKSPSAVLKIVGSDSVKDFTVQRICSTETFIEVSAAKRRNHLERASAAVERVTEAGLQIPKQACLALLRGELTKKARAGR